MNLALQLVYWNIRLMKSLFSHQKKKKKAGQIPLQGLFSTIIIQQSITFDTKVLTGQKTYIDYILQKMEYNIKRL